MPPAMDVGRPEVDIFQTEGETLLPTCWTRSMAEPSSWLTQPPPPHQPTLFVNSQLFDHGFVECYDQDGFAIGEFELELSINSDEGPYVRAKIKIYVHSEQKLRMTLHPRRFNI